MTLPEQPIAPRAMECLRKAEFTPLLGGMESSGGQEALLGTTQPRVAGLVVGPRSSAQ